MSKIYNVGIIGFGSMATCHYKEMVECKDVRVNPVGVYDINEKRMEYARSLGMKSYDSREALLNDPDIDIVLVATTNDAHKDNCIAALEAGKHCICEKPVTMNPDELREIIAVSERTGKVFTINHNRRTNHDFLIVKKAYEEHLLGNIYIIESRVEGSRGMPRGWRTLKRMGGGMMLDWGVHMIDQILYLIDSKVKSVYADIYTVDSVEVDDNFRMDMKFENGITAHIEVETNNYITHPRWYVLGKDGTLRVQNWDSEGEITRRIESDSEWEEDVVMTKAGPTKTMAPRRPETVENLTIPEPESLDKLIVVYQQFVAAIEGEPLKVTPQQALRTALVMEAAFESSKTQSVVKVDI